ncbi:MAG: 8-oxo-dGTP diphosphatase [Clostridiales bacterium]|nr:8-oxo-dGTP diphosphatase [Clostridiales bacterium]
MFDTTLCYIEKDGAYLMMHRIKKENDINKDKWVGIGGKFENGETAFQCVLREIKEETGIIPLNLRYRGIVEFISDKYETENMHLFTADGFEGEIKKECAEGELVWVKKEQINNLKIWEGDKIFFDLLEREEEFFYLTLKYKGDKLIEHKINIKSN